MLPSLVGFDGKGEPLTPLYTWADTRGEKYADRLSESIPDFHSRTGCVIHPMYPAIKLLWLREEKPETFQSVPYWGSIKSFVLSNLADEGIIEDQGVASASGLLNTNLGWDEGILSLVEVSKDRLPRLVEATREIRGGSDFSKLEDIPVYPGAGDGMLAHLSTSGLEKTQLSSTIGTSGALRVASPEPLIDPEGKIWNYNLFPDWWIGGGAINNGGLALKWFIENLGVGSKKDEEENTYRRIDRLVQRTEPGASGLVFAPFLTGERSPEWRSYLKGGFVGLTLSHGREEMLRAIMEGIIYRMKAIRELLRPYLADEVTIRASGGYTRSKPWLQIQADVFDSRIEVPIEEESAARGAAMAAMKDRGVLEEFPDPEIRQVFTPDRERARLYQQLYENHMELYRFLVSYYED